MWVVATAGHVDHGKSTLVHRLTGTQPDRWAEERRRGLTIDLGFAWTELAGDRLAFVDVPGHERFVPNTLAGIGPVPAVLFVVAADEGWARQSAEHLAALDALGVRHGVLAITKADRADPAAARDQALDQLAATSLGRVPAVALSAHTGAGLPALREALARLVTGLPAPEHATGVRLWLDRVFTVRGAGTVVTGTLSGGRLRVGDELAVTGSAEPVRVRGLQALGEEVTEVGAVARVAVNLRGVGRDRLARGDALLTPGAWWSTAEFDVRLDRPAELHRELVLHLGSAAVPVRVRPLGTEFARLGARSPLPLRIGDRGLLRDPGQHRIAAGFEVLDVAPPALRRRGAAKARVRELEAGTDGLHQGCARLADLRAMGRSPRGRRVGEWVFGEAHWTALRARATAELAAWDEVSAGMPVDALRQRLALPDAAVVAELLTGLGFETAGGRVRRPGTGLPERLERAIRRIEQRPDPWRAPEAGELAELGLGTRELAAAERAGRLVRLAEGVVVTPDAVRLAVKALAGLPDPFTVSEARRELGTTRRVAVPLLELLDRRGHTVRHPDNRRSARRPDSD